MKRSALTRSFHYNGLVLPDPNPAVAPVEAMRILSQSYPELVNGKVEPPTIKDGVETYVLKVQPTTKG